MTMTDRGFLDYTLSAICCECGKRRGKHRAPNPRDPSRDWQCPSDDPEKRWDDPPKTFFREEPDHA